MSKFQDKFESLTAQSRRVDPPLSEESNDVEQVKDIFGNIRKFRNALYSAGGSLNDTLKISKLAASDQKFSAMHQDYQKIVDTFLELQHRVDYFSKYKKS